MPALIRGTITPAGRRPSGFMSAPEHPQIVWAEPFIPDSPPPQNALWANEQRPWSSALVAHILEATSQAGDLVVDPFANQAALPAAAQAHRRRVLVNNTNPAALLAVLTSAAPPNQSVLDTAFSRIADAPRRGRTLAHHIQALYETVCPECAQTIHATAFVWDRNAGEPIAKRLACPHCQASGQMAIDMADLTLVSSLEVRGAAYWGLLSRLVAPGDPQTHQARHLLEFYPPRALLAFSELLGAAEQRLSAADEQRAAKALILSALERCTSLAEIGPARSTVPRLAEPPTRFVEPNVWLAFERAYQALRERSPRAMPLAHDLVALRGPDGPGRILPFNLAAPELAERLEPGSVALILTEPPRFDPTAYALGFLWTGWLFGRDAASRLKTTLSVEQWTWDWYGRAMTTALKSLLKPLAAEGHLVMAFADRSSRRTLALIAAAEASGWRLAGQSTQAALLPDQAEPAWRLIFQPDSRPVTRAGVARLPDLLQQQAQEAALALVDRRAEPTPAVLVNTACGVRWAEAGLLRTLGQHPDAMRRPVSFLVEQARVALSPDLPPPGLRVLDWPGGPDLTPPFWESEERSAAQPLADRVESLVLERLETGSQPLQDLERELSAAFPGLETPDKALVSACMESYANVHEDIAHLREEDTPARRSRDLGEMLLRLHDLGLRFGFEVWVAPFEQAVATGLVPMGTVGLIGSEEFLPASVVWHQGGLATFAFAVSLQAKVHPWLVAPPDALAGCPRYVVLPGGRAALLDFKLRRCPWWRDRLAWAGWDFVKFRHVRDLAASSDLSLAGFRARIGLDPIVSLPGQQLTLFDETRSSP